VPTLSFTQDGLARRFDVPPGETLIGRALTSGLVLNDASVSRHHATLINRNGQLEIRDAGSRFGTLKNGIALTGPTEANPGDTITLGRVEILVVAAPRVSLDEDHLIDRGRTVFRPVMPIQTSPSRTGPAADSDRLLTLFSDIASTLVLIQPVRQVFEKIIDLIFASVPAERAVLLLREPGGALEPVIARMRDGIVLTNTRISRTIVEQVMSERVAMLSADTSIEPRLANAPSLMGSVTRSFMCAPLWNRSEVVGVLYADTPALQQFSEGDLRVFTALSNYAAVAIEQARVGDELITETKRRERLQRYHSPDVVSRILAPGVRHDAEMSAQARDVTVMFADIVEFTALSQRLPPADVVTLLSTFFEVVTDIVFRHEGTVDKFIGDCVMAVFGAPFDQVDHARRCVQTACDVRRAIETMNREIAVPLRIRIAINSGEAMVGDVGSDRRREFTVLGDVVNAASRLERLAKPGQILISEATYLRAGADVPVNPLGSSELRGQVGEIKLFEVTA